MSRRSSPARTAPGSAPSRSRPNERDLLAQLGLSESAGPSAVDAAHADIVAFLESAPSDLRSWTQRQIAAVDEAYALLSDPEALDRLDDEGQATAVAGAAPPEQSDQPMPVRVTRRIGRTGRLVIAAGVVVGLLGGGYLVYASDVPSVPGLTGTPVPEASAQAFDSARVAELMQAIQADAGDTAALQELADIYFAAGDYETAASWENKVLAVAPDDVTAHLALGAALYNQGSSTEAETHWRRVLEIEPDNLEAHYDLGFMYFSADPPDVERTIIEWRRVIEIAPDSDIAQTVSAHLDTIEQWQSSASPSIPASSAQPAPSGQ
jgi:cytochrome c-type biogenesis protein CcmH/NrfG